MRRERRKVFVLKENVISIYIAFQDVRMRNFPSANCLYLHFLSVLFNYISGI
jgi:hypothetical protein